MLFYVIEIKMHLTYICVTETTLSVESLSRQQFLVRKSLLQTLSVESFPLAKSGKTFACSEIGDPKPSSESDREIKGKVLQQSFAVPGPFLALLLKVYDPSADFPAGRGHHSVPNQ